MTICRSASPGTATGSGSFHFLLPAGDPHGDLRDQRDRVGQRQPAQADQASRRISHLRSAAETVLFRAAQHQSKMDDATSQLESCAQSIYDPDQGVTASAVSARPKSRLRKPVQA